MEPGGLERLGVQGPILGGKALGLGFAPYRPRLIFHSFLSWFWEDMEFGGLGFGVKVTNYP